MEGEFRRALPASITSEKFVRTAQTAMLNAQYQQSDGHIVLSLRLAKAAGWTIIDGREAALCNQPQGPGTIHADGARLAPARPQQRHKLEDGG